MFARIGTWLVLMTPMGEPCHVCQCKLVHSSEAAGPTHGDYMAAVDCPRALYNGAPQRKELQKCIKVHMLDKRSGLELLPTSHHIRWSQANEGRSTAFLLNVSWLAPHLDLKVPHSTEGTCSPS